MYIHNNFRNMLTLEREEIKKDSVFCKLKDEIVKHHQIAQHTMDTLIPMVDLPGYAENATCFMVIDGAKEPLYLTYVVSTGVERAGEGYNFTVRVESITVYDDELEYEIHKSKLRQN